MNNRIILLLAVAATLSACEQTKTQEYYMSHPAELAADLAECSKTSKNTFNCNEATKAAALLKKTN